MRRWSSSWRRAFHGTAVPEIARRAGVSAGTIYNYFDSKVALVNVLFRTYKGAITSDVYANFPVEAEPRQQFGVMWGRIADFARGQAGRVSHSWSFTSMLRTSKRRVARLKTRCAHLVLNSFCPHKRPMC